MMQIEVPTEKVQTLQEQLQTMPGMNATVFEEKKMETTLTPHVACTYDGPKESYFLSFLFYCVLRKH
jgi:hypothetical protein